MTPAAMARRLLGMSNNSAKPGFEVRMLARTSMRRVAERMFRRIRFRLRTWATEAQTAPR